jgi:DNA-binding MarR family transcriptional regulator
MPGTPELPPREKSAGWMFKTISNWIDEEMSRKLKSLGISRVQFPIMIVLLEEEGLTQVEIGKRIHMPGYATSRNIDQLERKNLVKRQLHESSRRSHRIYLTSQGTQLAPQLFSVAHSISDKLLDPFEADEKELFRTMLYRVTASVVLNAVEPSQ